MEIPPLGTKINIRGAKAWARSSSDTIPELKELLELNPPDSIWQVFEKISTFKDDSEFFQKLVTAFVTYIKTNPDPKLFDLYGDIISQMEKTSDAGFITDCFIDLQEAGLSQDEKQNLEDIISYTKERDSYSRYSLVTIVRDFTNLFGKFTLSGEMWQLYLDIINYKKQKHEFIDRFIRNYSHFIRDTGDANNFEDIFQLLKKEAEDLMKSNKDPDYCVWNYQRHYSKGMSHKVYAAFNKASRLHDLYDRHHDYNREDDHEAKLIDNCFSVLAIPTTPVTIVENYTNSLPEKFPDTLMTSRDAVRLLNETTVHALICNLLRHDDPSLPGYTQFNISHHTYGDTLPFPVEKDDNKNPFVRRIYKETFEVYARIFDIYHGFTALTFDTKRPPGEKHSLLARFGIDTANKIRYFNSSDPKGFPGNGFLISGIDLEKVFGKENEKKDPYEEYKLAWPWAANEFSDLEQTHFIFTRGFIAISCMGNPKYELKDIGTKKVHYSLIIYNDHHHNDNKHIAFLIPTEVLRKKIEGTTIPQDKFKGYSPDFRDINKARFNYDSMSVLAVQIPANILNIGWGSNIGGGLCNAYPPESEPYHRWERRATVTLKGKEVPTPRDIFGHAHKGIIRGEYTGEFSKEWDEAMIPLREAHWQIYNISTRYQNLLDLFRIAFAMWRKEDPMRMFEEAYKWHSAKKEGKDDRNYFPALAIHDTLDYWTVPKSPVLVDTFDMSLKIGDKKISLNAGGIGDYEKYIWLNEILPLAKDSGKDIRFYSREDVGLE